MTYDPIVDLDTPSEGFAKIDANFTELFSAGSGGVFVGTPNNSSVDSAIAIQAANDAIVASGIAGVIELPEGILSIKTAVQINLTYVAIKFNNTTLDASYITTGTAFTFTGSVVHPYRQAASCLYGGFEVIGNSKVGSVLGMDFKRVSGSGDKGPAHASAYAGVVHSFGTGVRFGSGAYCQTFFNFDVYDCNLAISYPSGADNTGERYSFVGGTFFNNNTMLDADDGSFFFVDCSIDYNPKQFDLTSARVYLIGCHIEGDQATSNYPFTLSGTDACVQVIGGDVYYSGTASMPAFVNNNAGASGGVFFKGVTLEGIATTSGFFADGTGQTIVEDCPQLGVTAVIETQRTYQNSAPGIRAPNGGSFPNFFVRRGSGASGAGWNWMEFQDTIGASQAWLGAEPSGHLVLASALSGKVKRYASGSYYELWDEGNFGVIKASQALNFPSIGAGALAELTMTATGAATGDTVALAPPSTLEAGLIASGRVSATNTVAIRVMNATLAAIDPASATWRVHVFKQ